MTFDRLLWIVWEGLLGGPDLADWPVREPATDIGANRPDASGIAGFPSLDCFHGTRINSVFQDRQVRQSNDARTTGSSGDLSDSQALRVSRM